MAMIPVRRPATRPISAVPTKLTKPQIVPPRPGVSGPSIPRGEVPSFANNGTAVQPNMPVPGASGSSNLASLQAKRAQLQKELARRGGAANAPGFAKQLHDITGQIRDMRQTVSVPSGEVPGGNAGPNGAPPDGGLPDNEIPKPDGGTMADNAKGLFPGITMFEPQNYEGSPTYKFQQEQGSRALNRLMAARGLTGSGAEIEANSKFLNQLGAQEADRMQRIGETEADRLERMQENQANRNNQQSNSQWGRYMDLMNFAAGQNPMQYAMGGLNNLANLGIDLGKANSQYTGNNYKRVSAPPGGGGGGTPPVFTPPFPSSPDYSILSLLGAGAGGQNRQNIGSTIMSGLSGLFGLF